MILSIAIAAALILFILPSNKKDQSRLINWEVVQKIPWGALILIGGGLSLASVTNSSGLAAWIGMLWELIKYFYTFNYSNMCNQYNAIN